MPGNLRLLVKRFVLILFFFSVCRLLFLVFNASYFAEEGFASILKSFVSGLRFDITAAIICNLPFIVFHFNPFPFFYKGWYQWILKILFIITNSVCLSANVIDTIVFRFTGKRATADAFSILAYGEDFVNTLPHMLLDFWYLVLLIAVFSVLMYKIYGRIRLNNKKPVSVSSSGLIQYSKQFLYNLSIFALVFIGFRGGIQYRPINIMTASQHGSPKLTALILNTPFSIIKTWGKEELIPLKYFPQEEAERISPTLHQGRTPLSFGDMLGDKPRNVVIIILESFGKEYIGSLNSYPGYTPFLDSLMKESLVFTDAYANAKRSMEGIPAVVAGIPALMNEPFVTSAYNGIQITGLAKLLKKKNYTSAFYHGGTNGTMNFDNFSRVAGYDRYIGRREYNNDQDFDGSWGIYDEPFFQFFAQDMNKTQQPFFTTIFSVSSHHPYSVPKKYKNTFKKGTLPIHQSVMYADYSLKKFFETASKMPWFKNTLFVITADHTAISEYPKYQTNVGIYSVPIVFYMPGSNLKGQSKVTTEQIDVLPSVLDVVGYDEKYFAFGNSVFDSTASHFAVNFLNDNYQIISGGYALSMDTAHTLSLYHYSTDSLLQNNLLNTDTALQNSLEKKLKAFIQNYNHALIENKMTLNH